MHQIALVSQKALVKPGEDEYGGQNDQGKTHAYEQTHGDDAYPLAEGAFTGVGGAEESEAVDQSQDEGGGQTMRKVFHMERKSYFKSLPNISTDLLPGAGP